MIQRTRILISFLEYEIKIREKNEREVFILENRLNCVLK